MHDAGELDPHRPEPVECGQSTEGASLPANLSGLTYRIELATLKSGSAPYSRAGPAEGESRVHTVWGCGETLRPMTEGEFYPQPARQENSVTETTPPSDTHLSDADTSQPSPERLSPLHAVHVAAGASFTDFAGWQMPVSYGSDLAEHHAVRTAAGLFDLSHMGEIFVVGPAAAAALDYALAGKISAVAVGQAKYSLLLSADGGIVDDLVVYRTGEDRFLVVANASNRVDVARELLARSTDFDCEVFDESDDIALIAVQGPRAFEILSQVPGVEIDDLESLKYYWSRPGTFGERGEHELLVARTGYTGEDGFEIYLAPSAASALWEAIMDTGAGSGLVPAGLASRDTLRLEAGMPLYGHELGLDTRPAAAGLGRVVNLKKEGDFVGRAAIEAGDSADGPSADGRVLVGLTAAGKRAGRAGYSLFSAEDAPAESVVGTLTSGALSPTLGYPIAMAYVDAELSAADTPLFIDVRGKRIPATVVPLPFYKRESR
jgi:aminomethyltransferase